MTEEQQPELESTAVEEESIPVEPEPDETPEPEPPPPAVDPDEVKPTPLDLAVRDREDVYRAFDQADEMLILDELQGRALETFVYSFSQGGTRVTDLSVVGVNEAVRLLNERQGHRIRITPDAPLTDEFTEEGKTFYRVMVYAEDAATGAGGWGAAVEPKHIEIKRGAKAGKTVWDKFALTKALNKAERNAKKKLIPEEFRQTVIATFLQDESRVRRLRSVAETSASELPAPATGEEADTLRTEIREAYAELKTINRMKVPPGTFDANFTSSDHSLERLRAMLGWLKKQTEEARAEQDAAAEGKKPDA